MFRAVLHVLFLSAASSAVLNITALADMHSDFIAEADAIRKDAVSLDEAWYRTVARLDDKKGNPLVVLRIVLSKSVYGKDLHMELYRHHGQWIRGLAWAPTWNAAMHRVDASQFTAADEAVSGSIKVRLMPDGLMPLDNKALDVIFEINARQRQGVIQGKFNAVPLPVEKGASPPPSIPASKGTVEGKLAPIAGELLRPSGLRVQDMGKWDVFQIYAEAIRAETQASHCYQMIRAAVMAVEYGISYKTAEAETLPDPPVRPEFDPPGIAKDKKESRSGPTLDDISLDLADNNAGGNDGAPGKDYGVNDPKAKQALETLKSMRTRTANMVRFVALAEQKSSQTVAYRTDSETVGDPDFGPWYGDETLPHDEKTGIASLPTGAGNGIPPRWPCVGQWKMLGPLPLTDSKLSTPLLPEIMVDLSDNYKVDKERLTFGIKYYSGPETISWTPISRATSFGYIHPPNCSRRNRVYWGCPRTMSGALTGIEHSTLYAVAEIRSDRDQELWAGLGLSQWGKLWLNDRLLWTGPTTRNEDAAEEVFLIRIPFKQGVNRLLLRCDVAYSSPFFWLRICTDGRPRTAAELAADKTAIAGAMERISPQTASGWRGNGSGLFEQAAPPVAWNFKKQLNVIWRTPLRFWSNSSPALAGDRLFVGVEPDLLVCLSKADGKILWERHCCIIDLLPADDRDKGWALYDAWWNACRERDAVPARILNPHKWVANSFGNYWEEGNGIWAGGARKQGRENASPKLRALIAKRDELKRAEDLTDIQDQLTVIEKQIDELKAQESDDPETQAATGKESAFKSAMAALDAHLKKYVPIGGWGGYWYDFDGRAFATPVTDGKHVWWKNGTGVAGCFDLDGNRVWLQRTGGAGYGSHTISSPLLVANKLVLLVPCYKTGASADAGSKLIAFEAPTGAPAWESEPIPNAGWGAGTPAVLTLTNGKDVMQVIVTSGGSVVRADDGKVLAREVGVQCGDISPNPVGDKVLFGGGPMSCVRLIMKTRDVVGYKRLWTRQHGGPYGGLVTDEKLIYYGGSYGGPLASKMPSENWSSAILIDMEKGALSATMPVFRKGGQTYALSGIAGSGVYMLGGEDGFMSTGGRMCSPKPPHHVAVLTRGPDPVVLALNAIERTCGGPIMENDRLYIRGYQSVACVGYTGDEGRTYEARTVAESLLDRIQAQTPEDTAVIEPKAKATGYPRLPAVHGASPAAWLYVGPFPLDKAEAALEALGGPAATPEPEATIEVGGVKRKLVTLSQDKINAPNVMPWEIDGHNFTLIHRHRRVVDLAKVISGNAAVVSYLYLGVYSETDQTVRFEIDTPGARAWIGGAALKSGQRVRLTKGQYPLLVEVRVPSIPEQGLYLSPRLWESNDVAEECARWQGFVRRFKPQLEQVVKLAPASPEAARSRTVLQGL